MFVGFERQHWDVVRQVLSIKRANGKIVDVKSAVAQLAVSRPGRDVTLFKMHGDVDRPDEAVATKDDYERYLAQVVDIDQELGRTAAGRASEAARRLLDTHKGAE